MTSEPFVHQKWHFNDYYHHLNFIKPGQLTVKSLSISNLVKLIWIPKMKKFRIHRNVWKDGSFIFFILNVSFRGCCFLCKFGTNSHLSFAEGWINLYRHNAMQKLPQTLLSFIHFDGPMIWRNSRFLTIMKTLIHRKPDSLHI